MITSKEGIKRLRKKDWTKEEKHAQTQQDKPTS